MINIYYNPEDYNLVQVAQLEHTLRSYEFDLEVVWQHEKTGILYYAADSGCSCPSPFEAITGIEELERISSENFEDFKRRTLNRPDSEVHLDDKLDFVTKVGEALRERERQGLL